MGSGGQNSGQNWNTNQSWNSGSPQAYSGMFSGAANNSGNTISQAINPLMQQSQFYNPFSFISNLQSPLQQPNYNYQAPANTPPTSIPPVDTSSPATMGQSQNNTAAGLPPAGQPITPPASLNTPVQASPMPSSPVAGAQPPGPPPAPWSRWNATTGRWDSHLYGGAG